MSLKSQDKVEASIDFGFDEMIFANLLQYLFGSPSSAETPTAPAPIAVSEADEPGQPPWVRAAIDAGRLLAALGQTENSSDEDDNNG